jgi:ribosomal protein S18 acetylase RimI-like enzyme
MERTISKRGRNMVKLSQPTREEFDRWFALSAERQAEDRAWVNGTDRKTERAQLDALVPVILPNGMDTPNHAFRIVRDTTGTELGFVWVGTLPGSPEGTSLLFDVYVHADHRGRGIGREALERVFELLRADGITTLALYVRADNAPARALYAHLGFVAEEAPDGARDLQMRKVLEPDPWAARALVLERQHVAVDNLPERGWILDIGGGGEGIIGRVAGERVVAIDRLREELDEAPAGPLKIVMDAGDLQFPDAMFRTATAFFSFLYMRGEDHGRVFREVLRVLAPGGRLLIWDAVIPPRADEARDLIACPITAGLPNGEKVSTSYGVRWPAEGRDAAYYRRLAESVGFEVVSSCLTGQHVSMELEKP